MEWGAIIGILALVAVFYGGYRFFRKNLSDDSKPNSGGGSGSTGGSDTPDKDLRVE